MSQKMVSFSSWGPNLVSKSFTNPGSLIDMVLFDWLSPFSFMSTTSEDSSPVERNMIYNELYSQHFADTPIAASRPNSTQTPTTPNNSPASPINIQLNRSSIQENTFNSVKWSESIKEVPDFIKSMGVYPISTVFATCFQEELDDLNNTWRDENGELLDTEDVQELEKVLKRIDLLENSIEFLKRCVPPGR